MNLRTPSTFLVPFMYRRLLLDLFISRVGSLSFRLLLIYEP